RNPRTRRAVCIEIAQNVLNASQNMLEHRGRGKVRGAMPEVRVEHPSFLVSANPAHGIAVVLAEAARAGVALHVGPGGIDGQQDVKLFARVGRGAEAEEVTG